MRRSRAVAVGVDVPVGVVMAVVVGAGVGHEIMLYYNITGVYQRGPSGAMGRVANTIIADSSYSPPSAKRRGGVGGGGCLGKFAARGAS